MRCRDKETFLTMKYTNDSGLYQWTQERTHALCPAYWDSPRSYIGLGTASSAELMDAIAHILRAQYCILDFVVRLNALDYHLNDLSARRFAACQQIEMARLLPIDPRLDDIRRCFEAKVVARFLENYTWASGKCRMTEDQKGVVHEYGKSTVYSCNGHACDCYEMELTGVACPHRIFVAYLRNEPSYMSLLSPRWKKSGHPSKWEIAV